MSPIHYSALNGHFSVVDYLVKQGADINAKGYSEMTPLHFSVENGYLDAVEYLLNHGAHINAKDSCGSFQFFYILLFICHQLKVILIVLNT